MTFDRFDFNKNKINVVLNCEALGDSICAMPTIKNLIKEDRISGILAPPKWEQLLDLYDVPREIITFVRTDGALTNFDNKSYLIAPFYLENRAPYRIHLIDFFSFSVSYSILKAEEKSIKIDPSKLPENPLRFRKYVVMQGSTRLLSRTMPTETWCNIRDYLFSSGYEVVLLGHKVDKYNYDTTGCNSEFLDCDIAMSASICSDAACVVGVDGGLIYIAATTDVPIVAGYTFVDPYYRAPWRDGIYSYNFFPVKPRSDCYYCTNSLCAYGIEFDKSCPRGIDFDCQKKLHSYDFIFAISLILEGK